ncbi:hypothetical protein GIB67_025428 [Kingdonia uniflora]|uniref:NAC domain-containing protein n=1 Tax=Kingdonia uniflora TaxID=39325 RepID=A0A7J7N189_9MAGN|nr:hypothetical protein GIB67_025428 [Kingdonia uniflora]
MQIKSFLLDPSKSKSKSEERWPPGFRFHPTDEELVLYYLKRKICGRRLRLNVISDTDVYKWDPEDLPGQCALKTGDRQWYFFSPRDRKYPNGGGRSNRATAHGYWKATGKDRVINCNSRAVGLKKTLVFYKGRAPNGQRTDWVMHEYTLAEDELKRCKAARDYYALYKVYKKSGPGPKNGEQYGALFVEEEWLDEDETIDDYAPNLLQFSTATSTIHENASACNSINDIDNFLNDIVDDSGPKQPHTASIANLVPEVGEEIEQSLWEAISFEPSTVLHPSQQQQTIFNVTETSISLLPSCEAPEVTSATSIFELDLEEENFLEINDLMGPEPTFSSRSDARDNLVFEEEIPLFNGPEHYFDADMFLHDVQQTNQGTTSEPYLDCLKDDMANRFGFQLSSQLDDADSLTTELWSHDQNNNDLSEMWPNEVAMTPTSGIGTSNYGVTKDQEENEGSYRESWFNSAVWSFLDSVPTRPAEASESALINRAFERMSSFGRVQIGYKKTDVAAGVEISVVGRKMLSGTAKMGFVLLSLLGVLCAVLWVSMVGYTFSGRPVPSS